MIRSLFQLHNLIINTEVVKGVTFLASTDVATRPSCCLEDLVGEHISIPANPYL